MKKNIMFVTPTIGGYGGASKMIAEIANNVSRTKYNVFLYVLRSAPIVQPIADDVVLIRAKQPPKIKGLKRIIEINRLCREMKKRKTDCVVAFRGEANLAGVIAAKKLGIPSIICERCDPGTMTSRSDRMVISYYEKADGAVFQTNGAKAYFSPELQQRSTVIPNIAPNPRLVETDMRTSPDEIAFPARFDIQQKRQDIMVEAFAIVRKTHPDIRLAFYGAGDDEQTIRQLVRKKGLVDAVTFYGVAKDVPSTIRTARMFVLSSDYEGIPNTLIEAMSVGLACVSTDCSPGGAALLIRNRQNGLLVPKGDIVALAEAINFILENPEEAKKMGDCALSVTKDYSLSKIVSMWDEYIGRIIYEFEGHKNRK